MGKEEVLFWSRGGSRHCDREFMLGGLHFLVRYEETVSFIRERFETSECLESLGETGKEAHKRWEKEC